MQQNNCNPPKIVDDEEKDLCPFAGSIDALVYSQTCTPGSVNLTNVTNTS